MTDPLAVVDSRLSRGHFKVVLDSLKGAIETDPHLDLAFAAFPNIAIRLRNDAGLVCAGLLVSAADFPLRPLSVRFTDAAFRNVLVPDAVPKVMDDQQQVHVVASGPDGRAWFCIIGTREYHDHYRDALPWESVRDLASNQPGAVLRACVACIDLAKLVPIMINPTG